MTREELVCVCGEVERSMIVARPCGLLVYTHRKRAARRLIKPAMRSEMLSKRLLLHRPPAVDFSRLLAICW